MNIVLVGLSHKTAPVEVRERMAFTPAMIRSALTYFGHTHTEGHLAQTNEGVILSTCNRLEIYATVYDVDAAIDSITKFLSEACDVPLKAFASHLYILQDDDVVWHLMGVAAGIDSMVVGEPQILGQIARSYEAALSQDAAGTILASLFRSAIRTGKRARTETAIGYNAASVSSVAARLVEEVVGDDYTNRQVLLIGAGEMGAVTVRSLINRGIQDIVVANRTYDKAVELANAWNGRAISMQQLPKALAEAEIIITSTGAPHSILSRETLELARENNAERDLFFIIDLAVPRDVDPEIQSLPNVSLYNIDDLQEQADENVKKREGEIPKVQTIVEDEVVKFMAWFASLDAVPTITALRRRMEGFRQDELTRLFNRLELDDREQNLVATMSHRLVNKILHDPTIFLKQEAASGNGTDYIMALRKVFALDEINVPPV